MVFVGKWFVFLWLYLLVTIITNFYVYQIIVQYAINFS